MTVDFNPVIESLKTALQAKLASASTTQDMALIAKTIQLVSGKVGYDALLELTDGKTTEINSLANQLIANINSAAAQKILDINNNVSATLLNKDLTGATTPTLSNTEFLNKIHQFIGVSDTDITLSYPAGKYDVKSIINKMTGIGKLYVKISGQTKTIRVPKNQYFGLSINDTEISILGRETSKKVKKLWDTKGSLNGLPWRKSAFIMEDDSFRMMGHEWDNSYYGHLGIGVVNDSNGQEGLYFPTEIQVDFDFANEYVTEYYSSGSSSYVLTNLGNVYVCGFNNHGQLGLGHTNVVRSYIRNTNLINITKIVGSIPHWFSDRVNTLFLRSDGKVLSCGHNDYGTLGDGSTTQRTTPVIVNPVNVNFVDVFKFGGNVYGFAGAIDDQGRAWMWGGNLYSCLGIDNDTTQRNAPTLITGFPAGRTVKKIVGSVHHDGTSYYAFSLFLLDNGDVYGIGYNNYGQLGLGHSNNVSVKTKLNISNVKDIIIAGMGYHSTTCLLLNDGTIRTTGANSTGSCGDGTTTHRNGLYNPGLANIIKVIPWGAWATGNLFYNMLICLDKNGDIWSAGYNGYGWFGNRDNSASQTLFVKAFLKSLKSKVIDIAIFGNENNEGGLCALTDDGDVYASGGYGPGAPLGTGQVLTQAKTMQSVFSKVFFL